MFGPDVKDVLWDADALTVTLDADDGTFKYSKTFQLKNGLYYAVAWLANSVLGSPNYDIDLEVGIRDLTEAEQYAASTVFFIPNSASQIVAAETGETNWKGDSLSPAPFPFGRFKITMNGSNSTDTILQMKLAIQEENVFPMH